MTFRARKWDRWACDVAVPAAREAVTEVVILRAMPARGKRRAARPLQLSPPARETRFRLARLHRTFLPAGRRSTRTPWLDESA
ncbi:MAG: hypothetical protein JSS27_09010 [Planctomycetes bacterium]|nr:hypothetical protein [Planctomycetota bacterium]